MLNEDDIKNNSDDMSDKILETFKIEVELKNEKEL